MMKTWIKPIGLAWILLLLGACDDQTRQETNLGMQQNYFMQSLALVESAGETLQGTDLSKPDIDRALQQMDQGLSQAFQVEGEFLKQLDVRLPKLYNELFIPGVEQYRLGVESSDREQQLKGLGLLSRWGEFWLKEKPAIQDRLANLHG